MATIIADSVSRTDVNAAITAASNGDTVQIPAGSATWSSGIDVTKALIIEGAGSSSTVITSSGSSGSSIFDLTPPSDVYLTRITGIGFQLGTLNNGRRAIAINGKPSTAFTPTKIRIDNNAITGGGGNPGGIITFGLIFGVIDHNTITNCYSGIYGSGQGYDNAAWEDAFDAGEILAGTANAMFVEDNSFLYTSALGTGVTLDASVYIQEGGAYYVVRYNLFDTTNLASPNYINLMYNHHGNQEYYTGGTNFRAPVLFESYNNTANAHSLNIDFSSFRGGSILCYNETLSGAGTQTNRIKATEEEGWQSAFFSPLRTVWPAQDQVNNSFFWNNTWNGDPITALGQDEDSDDIFLQEDRDYFMHAPAASGGKESYTGTRYGGSTTHPTESDTGSMTFSSSGANAYYPYTPYTYPHPLQGGNGGTGSDVPRRSFFFA